MFQYENKRTFDTYALAESKGLIAQNLELQGGLERIHFFEGPRDRNGIQPFYWRAILSDGKIRRGEIRLDHSKYRVEFEFFKEE